MRSIGIDVHRDFCEVAVSEDGRLRSAGRVASRPEQLELFAASLAPDDEVALEATGNALAIARILEPHVARVVVASTKELQSVGRVSAVLPIRKFCARERTTGNRQVQGSCWRRRPESNR
jgi:hypothetical protein